MEEFDRKTSEVDIMITAPSSPSAYSTDSSEEDPEDQIYEDYGENHSESLSDNSNSISETEREARDEQGNNTNPESTKNVGGTDLCEEFDNGVSLSEEKPAVEEKEGSRAKREGNYGIVGDRVLVEKDGKFELVDANEIKAEYFEMLGIKPEGNTQGDKSDGKSDVSSSTTEDTKPEPFVKERPKTTPVRGPRNSCPRSNRAQSSWGERYRRSEYSHIRSPYGLSDKQLEIKKKREEAIARRKKEEEERAREEERRKREDAERAFQAWLSSKRDEEKERRRQAMKDQKEEDNARAMQSEKAFKAWKAAKKKQQQEEREEATRRMEETASMYVVHDRGACEEAFKRWVKKKKEEKKAKELEKRRKLRPKTRRKPKEPLPINSSKIRFTDNYGYRNTVVF